MQARFVRESLYTDEYYENMLYESILNENFDIKELLKKLSNIKDKKQVFLNLLNKFNKEHNLNIKKYMGMALIAIFLINFAAKTNKWSDSKEFHSHIQQAGIELSQKKTITANDVKEISVISKENAYKEPSTLRASQEIKDFIKKHEGLRLKAYDLGDGKTTIGYGHTGGNFNVGDSISKDQALKFFEKDLKKKEQGIQRMFLQWGERGNDIKLSQSMYDALVSMSYNIGISGLRNTDFIEDVEKEDFHAAAKKLPNTKISNKFPGLQKRRNAEHKIFSRDLS